MITAMIRSLNQLFISAQILRPELPSFEAALEESPEGADDNASVSDPTAGAVSSSGVVFPDVFSTDVSLSDI